MLDSARYSVNLLIALAAFEGLKNGEIPKLWWRDVEVFNESEARCIQIGVLGGGLRSSKDHCSQTLI